MRKIVVAVMSTISGLILLFSYHTSTNSETSGTTEDHGSPQDSSSAGTTPSSQATTTAPSSTSTSGGSTSSGSTSSSGTYTGDEVDTRWGVVQVEITVKDGKITAAEAVEYPNENPKDQQINAYALPRLNAEAVAAQGAEIDAVSGATVTSDGYIESLQSAIDAAHL